MSDYYPKNNEGVYYVEFERGNQPFEFTLFKRNYFRSPEEFEHMKKEASEGILLFMSNEGHPFQLFTGTYGPDGCIPDKKWVMWMVDRLNNV